MENEGFESLFLPDGTPSREGIQRLRSILMEHFENDILDLKANLGIHIGQKKADEVIANAVIDLLGEGIEIDGGNDYKVASKGNEKMVFYIFSTFEDIIIWEQAKE